MTQQISPASKVARWLAAAGVVALLGACASAGVAPVSDLATARASISQAESAGALQTAPVELLAARGQLAQAEAAAREEKFDQARRLAMQAEAQAEVAERKARAAKAKVAADEMARSNELLRQELARKTRP